MLGIGEERKGKGSTENFQSCANAVRDTPVLDTGHYMLVPNHRRYNPKGDPNANHGLGVITHQCKFIDYKKGATLVGGGENVGSYTGVGAGGIGEISIPSSQVYCEAETTVEKKNMWSWGKKKKKKKKQH